MRELSRCVAWTIALGSVALLLAAFAGMGLAQAEGLWAWAMLLVYWPFYLLGHVIVREGLSVPVSGFDAAVFGAQFLYFLVLTAGARLLYRRWKAHDTA